MHLLEAVHGSYLMYVHVSFFKKWVERVFVSIALWQFDSEIYETLVRVCSIICYSDLCCYLGCNP